MATRNLDHPSLWRAAWLAAVLIAGCGGGEVLLIPFFTFGFSFDGTIAGATRNIFVNLNPNAPTTDSGNFESGSSLRIDTVNATSTDSDSRDVTGSYSGCTLTLTVGAFKGGTNTLSTLFAPSYNGRFTGANTIQLTPTSGTQPVLTVTRAGGQVDPRPQTC
jgi:hypothetical protein